jgi:hypothetical protein
MSMPLSVRSGHAAVAAALLTPRRNGPGEKPADSLSSPTDLDLDPCLLLLLLLQLLRFLLLSVTPITYQCITCSCCGCGRRRRPAVIVSLVRIE